MEITATNKTWLEKTAEKLKVNPEILLNVILDRIRQKDQENEQELPDWIDAAGKDQTLSAELVEELRQMTQESTAAVKASRLYLNLIEKNKP